MISVEIRGKQFPLCLTVAALDSINEKCGGMRNLNGFLFPKRQAGPGGEGSENGDLYRQSENLTWMLGLLIKEGEANRIVEGQFVGNRPERVPVPGPEDLSHLLGVGEVFQYIDPIMSAISESLSQNVEAKHEKNALHAG